MTLNLSSFCTWIFCFCLFSFLAVHYAHMKSPGQYRVVASSEKIIVKPIYDASFKY